MRSLTPERFTSSCRPVPEHIARGHPPSLPPSPEVELAVLASFLTAAVIVLPLAVVLLAVLHLVW